MSNDTLNLQWREMRDDDYGYVCSSWLRSYRDHCPEFKRLARGVYIALYKPIVRRLLECATVAIAHDPDLPTTVLGFLVVEGDNVIHYVHTKERWRKLGVAKWMLRDFVDMPAIFTHQPSLIAMRLCGPTWKYDSMRRFEDERKAA